MAKSKKYKKNNARLERNSLIGHFLTISKFAFLLASLGAIIAVYVVIYIYANEVFAWFNVACIILGILFIIPIVASKMASSYKITWTAFIGIFPYLGILCYLMFANKKFSKKENEKYSKAIEQLKTADKNNFLDGYSNYLDADKDPMAHKISRYLNDYSHTDIYSNSAAKYFPWGEDGFPTMLEKLKQAKHYIFIEYFIIEPGKMWNSILEILIEKAKQGIDVRIIYDDFGCLKTLPYDYPNLISKYGIKIIKCNPLKPFLDIRMNNRNHRKIMVIDGHTGFSGGINLADEYINEVEVYGKWKDNVIMIQGDAVYGLTTLFLSDYALYSNDNTPINFVDYAPIKYFDEIENIEKCSGLIQAYGSLPYTFETVGEQVYEMFSFFSRKYLYISTPYLILDETMTNALCQAAKAGVDVRLLTPHIPDKKTVFQLTRRNYGPLLEAGVKIYEFTPGFVHEKMFLADDMIGTVGTINLDYRSLYLHSENGIFLYKTDCLKDMKKDFLDSFAVSQEYTLEMYKKTNIFVKIWRAILLVFAPLL